MDAFYIRRMELPTGYIKVTIDKVHDNIITPPVKGKFTDEFIWAGEIHGWPVKDVHVITDYISYFNDNLKCV